MPFNKVTPSSSTTRTDIAQSALSIGVDKVIEKISKDESAFDSIIDYLGDLEEGVNVEEAALKDSTYNTLLDDDVYFPSGRAINPDSIRHLRNSNRQEVVELTSKIKRIKDNYEEFAKKSKFYIEYDVEENPNIYEFMSFIFEKEDNKITSEEYILLEEFSVISEKHLNKDTFNSVSDEEDFAFFNDESEEPKSNKFKEKFRAYLELNPKKASFHVEAIDLFKEEQSNFGNNGMPTDSAYLLGYGPLLELEDETKNILRTLNQIDKNRSYIEVVLNRDLSEPQEYWLGDFSIRETGTFLWENCLDCFYQGWGSNDIRFGVKLEYDISLALKGIKKDFQNLLNTLDIPTQLYRNICSLMNLGLLCPVEIGFLLASIAGLLRFGVQGLGIGRGFLKKILYGILNGLLSPLNIMIETTLAPIPVYRSCTAQKISTILRAMEDITGNPNDLSIPLTKRELYFALNNSSARGSEAVNNWLRAFPPESEQERTYVNQARRSSSWNIRRTDNMDIYRYWSWTLNPLEGAEAAMNDFTGKIQETGRWITLMIRSIRKESQKNQRKASAGIGQIMALSTLATIVAAFASLLTNNIPVCESIVDSDFDKFGNPINPDNLIIIPRFTPQEMIDLISPNSFVNLETDHIIIDGQMEKTNNPNDVVINNTLTNNKYNLVSCEKGKVLNVSNKDLKSMLRNINA